MAARPQSLSTAVARWHADETTVGSPLIASEVALLRRTRVFGAAGTVLMAIGALGAGARPVVQDPTFGVRLLNLPSRIQTVSLTMTTTGAVMMALAWLMLGRFALGSRRMSRSQLDRTLLLWALPLLIAPPMYSKDVYSYLAQSQIARIGLDPYRVGPAPGLGLDHVFTLSVPSLWRDTPAPYGPLFLWIGRDISDLTGDNIVAAVLCHRLVVLLGVGLIVWATPRLARRCGVAEVSALWLGPCNPLLFMHLVAGIHNEALMLGLMLTGTEFALRAISRTRDNHPAGPLLPRPLHWPHGRGEWTAWLPLAMLLAGTVLITMSSQVKLPSLLAVGFVAMALACKWGGTVRAFVVAGGLITSIVVVVTVLIGWASGLGFGWLFTLGTANVVRSWMSPPTLIALGTGQVGNLLGLGDHTTAVLALTRAIGVIIISILVSYLLLAVLRGRLHPVGGLGVALGATVLLFPVVQPWYLLWAIIPLATWATRPGFRGTTIVITLIVGIFGPTANGDRFALFQILDATVASTIIVLALIAITYSRLPWRPLSVVTGADEPESAPPAPPAPKADAYAETPVTSRSDLPVRLRGVTKRYGSTLAVDGLDLEVQPAEVLALLGPNGAGKTTTIEMCEGFLKPDAGSIEILGLDPVVDNAKLRERIGVMLQGGGGYPAARAGEMLNLVAAYSARPLDPAWLMDTLGLTEAARTTYRRLSGGQQQRLALACAVVGRPELVFLDEPTAGMDAHARIVVWDLIDGLRRDGVTVVLTTHQLTEAEQLADRLVIIDHGIAVAKGTPAELMGRGAENQLRFSAPPKLDLSLLISALPESYEATEVSPGEYLVEGLIDPQVLATVTAWCARLNVLATDMRVEQRSLEDVFLDITGRELRS